jgi:GR25 family glycosyltransferase involved in LPS biosynthesis
MRKFEWRNCFTAYMNLDHRNDRNLKMQAELARAGISAQRFRGMYPHEYTGEQYKIQRMLDTNRAGAIGCHFTHVKIMQTALERGQDAFIMEDDVVLASDVQERLDYVQDYLNNHEWDVFWLGGTYHLKPTWHIKGHTHPDLPNCECDLDRDVETTDDPRIVRTYGCWCTYAYIVNFNSIQKVLDLMDSHVHESHSPDWLFIRIQPKLKAFAFVPAMAKQYDNESDIVKGTVHQFSGFERLGAYWYADKMRM